jgi:hypothetical protein
MLAWPLASGSLELIPSPKQGASKNQRNTPAPAPHPLSPLALMPTPQMLTALREADHPPNLHGIKLATR